MISFLLAMFLGQTTEMPRWVRIAESPGHEIHLTLPADSKLPQGELDSSASSHLRVVLPHPKTGQIGPALFGSYHRKEKTLVFRPRFPLEPGLTYRAEAGVRYFADYHVPQLQRTSGPPKVLAVHPPEGTIPANTLKFYIYFSSPIQGGSKIFEQIQLLDPDGKVIEDPWLLDELWDEASQCLIIYIHPGRIKWGVLLRETLGPVLRPGKDYRLVIRSQLKDIDGIPMSADHVVRFHTIEEDRKAIDIAKWKLTTPKSGSKEPLQIEFDKALDHRSIPRFFSVHNQGGMLIAGEFLVSPDQRSCRFIPSQPWRNEGLALHIDPTCEDLAGNTPRRPFDVDLSSPAPTTLRNEIEFRPVR